MQAILDELSKAVAPKAHPVVLKDQAGWHCAKALAVPSNLTLAFLPPYLPELTIIERVRPDYAAILDAFRDAWSKLVDEPESLKSLNHASWLS